MKQRTPSSFSDHPNGSGLTHSTDPGQRPPELLDPVRQRARPAWVGLRVPPSVGKPAAAAGSGIMGLSSPVIVTLTNTPWWIAALLITSTVVCALVKNVFPQDSADRLTWWQDPPSRQAE